MSLTAATSKQVEDTTASTADVTVIGSLADTETFSLIISDANGDDYHFAYVATGQDNETTIA